MIRVLNKPMSEHDKRLWQIPGWYLNKYLTMMFPQGQVYDNVRVGARAFVQKSPSGEIIGFETESIK